MKITSKARYGIRALLELAKLSEEEVIPLSEIANRQGVSSNYLEHHFSILKKAGLVKSIKGPQGGYKLFKRADEITLNIIIESLEGDISISSENSKDKKEINIIDKMMYEFVWNEIDNNISDILNSITLEDINREYKKRNSTEEIMYYI